MFRSMSLVVLLLLGAAVAVAKPGHYDTPRKAFLAARDAGKKGDWTTLCGCVTSESGDVMAGCVALAVHRLRKKAAKDRSKAIDTVFTKFGMKAKELANAETRVLEAKDDKTIRQITTEVGKRIKDKPGFLAAITAAAGKGKEGPFTGATLGEVTITGETARGTMSFKSGKKEKKETIAFVKQGGTWKIVVPALKFR